jgi:hypothetical protein
MGRAMERWEMHTVYLLENWWEEDTREALEDNIRMYLKEIWWEGVVWFHLAQDRDHCLTIVNTVVNLQVPWKEEYFLTSWVIISIWGRTLFHVVSRKQNLMTFWQWCSSLSISDNDIPSNKYDQSMQVLFLGTFIQSTQNNISSADSHNWSHRACLMWQHLFQGEICNIAWMYIIRFVLLCRMDW